MIKINRKPCPHKSALDNKNYKHPKNKIALKESSFGKCMYCESYIPHVDYAHIEHIKPKASGKFPQLEFDWNNLGYACGVCNGSKSDKYFSDCPFIDPYTEDPSEFLLVIGSMVFPKPEKERGEITIIEIRLNRKELIEKRYERLFLIQKAIASCLTVKNGSLKSQALKEIFREASKTKEYSFFVKFFFESYFQKITNQHDFNDAVIEEAFREWKAAQ